MLCPDPEDDAVLANVPDMSRDECRDAIQAAQDAFQSWRKTTHRDRRWLIRKWADVIKANKADLAAIHTIELGMPYKESYAKVDYATDFLDWFEGEVERLGGETIPTRKGENRLMTIRQPQGVVAAITPWNSPLAMITRKVGAAIGAGCTVVCKPAPETPLCAIALAKLFEKSGFPPGVFNVVTSSFDGTPEIGDEMCTNRLVRHLSFTGSTAVGLKLNAECAKQLKRVSMELGGNAPFIVFEDADVNKAVEGLIASKFRSSGQTCVCANRVLVHETVIDAFSERLAQRLPEVLVPGSVWDPKTSHGPLYSSKGVDKVRRHLKDAIDHGAKLVTGGLPDVNGEQTTNGNHTPEKRSPNFIPPMLLTLPNGFKDARSLSFCKEETFGPMAALIPFKEEKEAIELANDVAVGLAGYFYTNDVARMFRVAEELQTGMVGVRVGIISACEQPFGGIKQSGIGREGGPGCLEEYTELKTITIGL